MNESGSTPDGTLEDVRGRFERSDPPGTPLTATEVAADLDRSAEATRDRLAELVDRDELRTREVDGGPRVWWRPVDAQAADPDRTEYEAFVSAVRDYAIFTLDTDGVVVSWNEGARRIKGYDEDEIVGEHFSTFYTDEDIDDDVPAGNLATAELEGRVEDVGWRVRSDGTRFWANVTITAVRDDGELQGFTKVTRDMTEQREYELQLRRERDLTNRILETVPISITVIDEEGEFVRSNRRMLGRLDVEESTLQERSVHDWEIYDEDGEPIPTEEWPWARVVETGEVFYDFRCQMDLPSLGRRWLSVNAAPMEAGADRDEDLVVVSVEDVTEQRRHQRQLERRKADLETELSEILDRVSDAFYALDDKWRFTHLNEQAAGLMQRPREELLGSEIWEAFDGADDGGYREHFETAMEAQEAVDFEAYVEELDAWLEFNVYPSETGVSVYMHDITERKEYQRRLEESNERLEQFAYAASHDLQEPLRMVSSYLQLIERRYGDALDADGEEFLEYAVDGADRMRAMIEGLLEYSRVETQGDPFEPVDLQEVLEEARENLHLQFEESGADLTTGSLPTVSGDADQLRQVFQNLLDNAVEYSGDEPPRICVDAEPAGNGLVISVADDGIGIEPSETDRIFEVFHRLHSREEHDGTGIGLALCERIVERHGGRIWIDSEPGEGATVSFTLPST